MNTHQTPVQQAALAKEVYTCTFTLAGATYCYDYDELEMQQALLALRTYEHRFDQIQLKGSVGLQTDLDDEGTFATLRALAYLLKRRGADGFLEPFSKAHAEEVVYEELKKLKGARDWKALGKLKKNFFQRQSKLLLLSSVDSSFEMQEVKKHQTALWEQYAKADRVVHQQLNANEEHNELSKSGNEHGSPGATKS